MKKELIFEDLFCSIVDMDIEKGKTAAIKLIKEKYDPIEGVEKGLSKGMKVVGEKFAKLGIFLPDLLMATDIFNSVIEILKPQISKEGLNKRKKGTVVIGTVKGDIHKIGKDIVALLLEIAGFDVHNLSEDVPITNFIEETSKVKADIIALSSLLTTTMPSQKDLIDVLIEKGGERNIPP